MEGKSRYGSGNTGARAPAYFLAFLSVAVVFSVGASALSVTITSPPDGTWTAASSVTVSGSAVGPSADSEFLNSDADLAGGFNTNTTVSSGRVIQTFPDVEHFVYVQDFTGLGGQAAIDAHWGAINISAWEVSLLGPLSPNPPALAHGTTATESLTWMAALPGNATDGWVSFRYYCEANAFLNVYSSRTGHTATETNILSTTSNAGTDFWYNLSAQANGSDMFVLRFEAGSGSPTSAYCSVDDFSAGFNFTRQTSHRLTVSDTFASGPSTLWNLDEGGWGATASTNVSGSPPAFGHLGVPNTFTALVLALPNAATRATVGFTYQCEANGSLSAAMAGSTSSGFLILAGLRGAPSTAFNFDATAQLAGSTYIALVLAADSTSAFGDACAVDNVSIQVDYRGHLGLTYDGSYLSTIKDLGIDATLAGFAWWGNAATNTSVDVFARSSVNNLTFTGWTPIAPGSTAAGAPNGRYVQFRADFTSVGGFQTAFVDAFIANFSGIVAVEWSTDGTVWYLATGTSNWTATVPLGAGANLISVRARDTTGSVVNAQVQVLKDTSPPGAPGKPEAPAVTNQTSVTWNWTEAVDFGVGVSHYLVDVGLSSGGTELATEVQVNGTEFTYSGAPDGVTVYLSVRAVDAGGIRGSRISSNGTVVDRTAPGATTVHGPGVFSNAGSLSWTWNRPSDAGTGVVAYRVDIGSTAGGAEVFSGQVTSPSFTLTTLSSGTTYFATITAVDGAGNMGPAATSSGTTVDLDPPQGPGSVDGGAALTNASTVTWTWAAATDAISGVDHYRVEVGTAPGARDLADITTTDLFYTLGFVESGTFVFLGVTPVDVAGNSGSRLDAAAVHSDSTAPGNTTLSRVDPYIANATIVLEWSPVIDGPTPGASGVSHYVVRVRDGTSTDETTTTETTFQLSVADGVTYTVEVLAVDGADNVGPLATVTFTGDLSGPASPGVVTTRVSNPLGPSFTASWNATVDAGVGLKEYRVNIGTTPGGRDVASGVRVTRLNFTWTGTEGTQYWVTVWAVDKLDNAGPAVSTVDPISYTPATGGGGFVPGFEAALAAAALLGVAAAAGSARRWRVRRGRGMP